MNKQSGYTAIEILIVIFYLVGIGGWIANIVKLAGMEFDPLTWLAVIRAIGVLVAPLGAVLGFI